MISCRSVSFVLAVLAWGWVVVLLQPSSIMVLPSYAQFLHVGGRIYWLSWQVPIAVVSLGPLLRFRPEVTAGCLLVEMGWWIVCTVMFALRYPVVTGVPAYAVPSMLCAMNAMAVLRSGRH